MCLRTAVVRISACFRFEQVLNGAAISDNPAAYHGFCREQRLFVVICLNYDSCDFCDLGDLGHKNHINHINHSSDSSCAWFR